MNSFVRIRSTIRTFILPTAHRADSDVAWRDDIVRRLDQLAQAQTALVKAATEQIDSVRPPKIAWRWAIICLAAAAGLVISSALLVVSSSNLDGQAGALSEQAQLNSLQANQTLMPLLTGVTQSGAQYLLSHASADLAIAKTAQSFTTLSDQENAEVSHLQSSATSAQVFAQVSLALGSAFLGALLGWIVTQQFAGLRFYRRSRDPSSS